VTPGRYLVRDERHRLKGVLIVLEHTGTGVAYAMWTVAAGMASRHGQPTPPAPPPGSATGSLCRWAGETRRWHASDDDLRKLGVAEPAVWP